MPCFSKSMLGKIAFIAIPSILQQSFVSVGNLFIQGLVNSFGSGVLAGYSAAVKLNNFAITSFSTLGNGVSNFTAQNLGAGKEERVEKGFHSGILIAACIGVFFATGIFCHRKMGHVAIFTEYIRGSNENRCFISQNLVTVLFCYFH